METTTRISYYESKQIDCHPKKSFQLLDFGSKAYISVPVQTFLVCLLCEASPLLHLFLAPGLIVWLVPKQLKYRQGQQKYQFVGQFFGILQLRPSVHCQI